MQQEDRSAKLVEDQPPGNLPYLKPDDVQYFDKLLVSLTVQNSLVNSLLLLCTCKLLLWLPLTAAVGSFGLFNFSACHLTCVVDMLTPSSIWCLSATTTIILCTQHLLHTFYRLGN